MLSLIPPFTLTRFFTNIQSGYQHFLTLPPPLRPSTRTQKIPPRARLTNTHASQHHRHRTHRAANRQRQTKPHRKPEPSKAIKQHAKTPPQNLTKKHAKNTPKPSKPAKNKQKIPLFIFPPVDFFILPMQKHARRGIFPSFFTYFTHFTNKTPYIE